MRLRVLVPLLGLCLPAAAHAGGFYISDVGARGMARGGAFVAAPDTLLALHYNPAALTLLGAGAHAQISLVNVSFDYDFARACPCAKDIVPVADQVDAAIGAQLRPVSNTAAPQLVPFLSAAYQLPWYKTTVALGVYAFTSPGRLKMGERAGGTAQRYSLADLELYEAYYQLAIAIEPIEGLRFGLMAMLYDFNVQQSASLYTNSLKDPGQVESFEDPGYDVPIILDFEAPTRVGWGAGISYSPSFVPGLSIGASVLGQRHSRTDGTTAITPPRELMNAVTVSGNDVSVELGLAGAYRVGVEYAYADLFELEAAVVVETWSIYDRVVLRGKNVVVNIGGMDRPLGKLVVPTNFRDSLSLRFGGELKIWEPYLGIRGGYFYENGAVPDEWLDVSQPDLPKHGLAFGLSTTWYGATLDLGMNYVFMPERVVTTSLKEQNGAIPNGDPELLTIVGNGTYSGSYLILGASLAIEFDELVDSFSPQKIASEP